MRRSIAGFTLLEVLIAVAIIAISVTALLYSSSQDIKNSSYLKQQTVASRLALNTLHQIRLGLIKPPYPPYEHVDTKQIVLQKWVIVSKRHKIAESTLDEVTIEIKQNRRAKSLYSLSAWVERL